MARVKIYCTIQYQRGRAPGRGYVARFMRSRDGLYLGSATWNRKGRRFTDVVGVSETSVAVFANDVPASLSCDGVQWVSEAK